MESEGSSLCSQAHAIHPYPWPDESSSRTPTLLRSDPFKTHSNPIYAYVPQVSLLRVPH